MGTCVSRCYPGSPYPPSSSPSTGGVGGHSLSLPLCGVGGSPALSTSKHAVAVHPLPLASTSASSSLSTTTSSSTSTSSSAATSHSSFSSPSSSGTGPFLASGYLKVRVCRDMGDMEVVVLDPNSNNRMKNKKLSRPSSAAPRPRPSSSPRTPPALSVVRSHTKKKPDTVSNSNGRRTAPTTSAAAARRVRPLPPRPPPQVPPAGTGAGVSTSCRNKRPSSSLYSCRSAADSAGRRKTAMATAAAAGVGVGGEVVDDLNNPLMSMDCFIFL